MPSESMEETLVSGDIVLTNKIHYGPRMPSSFHEIPWINLFTLVSNAETTSKSRQWNYRRLSGVSNCYRNDIVVFNPPWEQYGFFIKRCIGIPKDTIEIRESKVYINQELIIQEIGNDIALLNQNCRIIPRKSEEQGISSSNEKTVETIWDKSLNWSNSNLGPFIIPYRGMIIDLDSLSYQKYKAAINWTDTDSIWIFNGKYYYNGKLITHYTFKDDFFFMMGDNRSNSNDSRCWGVVPEKNIVGKAVIIIISKHDSKTRFHRMLKRIY